MKSVITALLFGAFLSVGGLAQAQDMRIGYVDVSKVLNDSKAGKRVKGELEKTFKQRKEALDREEQKLKNLQQAYEKDKLLLSETQKQAKQKEFEEKVHAFRQSSAAAQQEVEKKKTEFERKALADIQAIVADVAKEEKLLLVFEKTQRPIYAVEGPDLSDKVLKRFDAKGSN